MRRRKPTPHPAEHLKGIGGHAAQPVIGRAQDELRARCNGAEFADDELVGFCVTGGSDDPDLPDAVTEHPLNKYLGTFLSHVYVDPDYRGNGYGARLVHDALLGYWESEGHQEPTFLDLSEYLFDDPDADPIKLAHLLIDFFGKNGFEPIPDDEHDITYTCMVLDPKNFKDPDAE